MPEKTEITPKSIKGKAIILIVQAIGFGLIVWGAVFFFAITTRGGLSLGFAILPGMIAIIGSLLFLKRKSGCVLFLIFSAIYPISGVLAAFGNEQFGDFVWFKPEYDWILFCTPWILGLYLFIKNRHLFR